MQKTKKINLIINVVFIVYLLISLITNCVKIYKDGFEGNETEILTCSMEELRNLYKQEYDKATPEERGENNLKPLEEISDEELIQIRNKIMISVLLVSLTMGIINTILKNIIIIIIFIIFKVVNKKVIKEKLNKDDFGKNKEYYRDILNGYGMCELSFIDDFEIEYPKDVVAELLKLENQKAIFLEDDKIIKNEKYDYQELSETQKYIIDHIKEGKLIGVNSFELQQKVKEDAIKNEIIEEKDEFKRKRVRLILKSIILFIVLSIINLMLFLSMSYINLENSTIVIILLVLMSIASIGSMIYPIITAISLRVYMIASKMNPYFRTKKGEELNKNIEGLKLYIKDYSLLNQQEKEGISIWEDYLVYSVLFGQNKKIVEQYEKYIEN